MNYFDPVPEPLTNRDRVKIWLVLLACLAITSGVVRLGVLLLAGV